MYLLIGRPQTVDALRIKPVLQTADRTRVPIVIVDDQDFPYLDQLRQNNYQITKLEDVKNVREVAEYPVVMCDIHGIGRTLGSSFEGAHLIAEIRKAYPLKYIIAYTAQRFDPRYNAYLSNADKTIAKDIDCDGWLGALDVAVLKAGDPVAAWRRLQHRLVDEGISSRTMMDLEDQYVQYVSGRKREFPDRALSSHLSTQVVPLLKMAAQTAKLLMGGPTS